MAQRKYEKYIIDMKETDPVSPDDAGKMFQPFESYGMHDNEETSIWCHPMVILAAGAAYTTGKSMEIDLLPGGRSRNILRGRQVETDLKANKQRWRSMPHKHPFNETQVFFGTDPKHPNDLGGEVEYWLGEGEDAEQYFFTKRTILHLPAGLMHGPIVWRRVDKPPIIGMVILNSPYMIAEYAEELPPGFKL